MPVIDDCCLILEDRSERVLLVREGATWQLPRCPAMETAGGDNLVRAATIGLGWLLPRL